MANFSKSSQFLVLSLYMVMMMLVHTQALRFDINNTFNETSDGLIYERDAFVPAGSSYLSLTASGNPKTSSVGRVLYTRPMLLWDELQGQPIQANFMTSITFRITPVDNNPSGGMTFFIVPVNSTKSTGGEGGNLGIYDALNEGSPFFTVEFDASGEPDSRHVGINVNSVVSQNVTKYDIATGEIVTATVHYDLPIKRIRVYVNNYGPDSAGIEYMYDLKTLLPREVQVGLSAASSTGENVDVIQWFFMSAMNEDSSIAST